MTLHLVCQYLFLRLIAVFEKLLYNVVPEDIGHKLKRIRLDLTENLIFLITVCSLQFLLDEAGTMLIATKFDDMVIYILKNFGSGI